MQDLQEEIIASSELYSLFPHYKTGYQGSIPSLVVPTSKYSSTETELSASNDDESSNVGSHKGRQHPSLSGFSTSAASSSGSSRRRRKRRRYRTASTSTRLSPAWLRLGVQSTRSESTIAEILAAQPITGKSGKSDDEPVISSNDIELRVKIVPSLNSVDDLKHAIGRHRGISGSSAPAVDAVLFAMFYATDIFDCLLHDSTSYSRLLHPQYSSRASKNNFLKADLLSLLRKEIVYSLRINYFCPASKIVKLVQLVDEHYPLEHIQDAAGFLDLLFRKLLKQCPFLTYSNGSTGFIHPIDLEYYLTRRFYYQPVALTVQQLLRQKNIFNTKRDREQSRGEESRNFATVPYPALIINIIRKASPDENVDDESMYYWDQSSETHHHCHKRPVIPNLKIDITDLIGRNDSDNSYLLHSCSGNWDENISFRDNQSVMMASSYQVDNPSFLSCESGNTIDEVDESRFVRGLKSAWKVVFSYLEDLTISSAHVNPQESLSLDENIRITNQNNLQSGNLSSSEKFFNQRKNNHLSSSLSSLTLSTSPSFQSYQARISELEESLTLPPKVQIKMELIAIICKSRKNRLDKKNGANNSFSGYSVYCKAGKDVIDMGGNTQYAPWMLYESRSGIAPQVVLIENFGKWMDSLEKHHESLSLEQVPMEIRRVLEDSQLFIYKRLGK